MNKLDPHTLFSIFEQGDEEIYKEHNVTGVLDNPYVLIGMVVTGVENFALIDGMYLLKYKEKYAKVREGIRHKYYIKLFGYLQRLEDSNIEEIYTIGEDYELTRSIDALLELQIYFQKLEYYEKCKVISRFSDLLIGKQLQTLI
tara:strand:+ start:251 stop:682 length:432 start_codon:yes stop_codon:yes gene_type:complete